MTHMAAAHGFAMYLDRYFSPVCKTSVSLPDDLSGPLSKMVLSSSWSSLMVCKTNLQTDEERIKWVPAYWSEVKPLGAQWTIKLQKNKPEFLENGFREAGLTECHIIIIMHTQYYCYDILIKQYCWKLRHYSVVKYDLSFLSDKTWVNE